MSYQKIKYVGTELNDEKLVSTSIDKIDKLEVLMNDMHKEWIEMKDNRHRSKDEIDALRQDLKKLTEQMETMVHEQMEKIERDTLTRLTTYFHQWVEPYKGFVMGAIAGIVIRSFIT